MLYLRLSVDEKVMMICVMVDQGHTSMTQYEPSTLHYSKEALLCANTVHNTLMIYCRHGFLGACAYCKISLRCASLVPRPRPQGRKGYGTHRALSGAHRIQHIMWLAWKRIVLAWQRINRSHTLQYMAMGQCHMIITCRPRGVNLTGALEFLTETSSSPRKHSMCTRPFPSLRAGSGNKTIDALKKLISVQNWPHPHIWIGKDRR